MLEIREIYVTSYVLEDAEGKLWPTIGMDKEKLGRHIEGILGNYTVPNPRLWNNEIRGDFEFEDSDGNTHTGHVHMLTYRNPKDLRDSVTITFGEYLAHNRPSKIRKTTITTTSYEPVMSDLE